MSNFHIFPLPVYLYNIFSKKWPPANFQKWPFLSKWPKMAKLAIFAKYKNQPHGPQKIKMCILWNFMENEVKSVWHPDRSWWPYPLISWYYLPIYLSGTPWGPEWPFSCFVYMYIYYYLFHYNYNEFLQFLTKFDHFPWKFSDFSQFFTKIIISVIL